MQFLLTDFPGVDTLNLYNRFHIHCFSSLFHDWLWQRTFVAARRSGVWLGVRAGDADFCVVFVVLVKLFCSMSGFVATTLVHFISSYSSLRRRWPPETIQELIQILIAIFQQSPQKLNNFLIRKSDLQNFITVVAYHGVFNFLPEELLTVDGLKAFWKTSQVCTKYWFIILVTV